MPITDQPVIRNILVIEDTPQFAKNALELENCQITLAGDMKTAIKLMREQKFDMVLSDLNFPTREGEKPKSQHRAIAVHCLYNNLPVAIVTMGDHHGTPHDQSSYRGEYYVFIKAFTPSDLVYLLADNGFREGYRSYHKDYTVPEFSLMRLPDTIPESLKTYKEHQMSNQPVKDTANWKKALSLLETSIAARNTKENVVSFWTSGFMKGLTIPKSGSHSGVPTPPKSTGEKKLAVH